MKVSGLLVELAFLPELGLKAICIGLVHIRIFANVWADLTNTGAYKWPRLRSRQSREAGGQSTCCGLIGQFPSSVLNTDRLLISMRELLKWLKLIGPQPL